jgi:hypothetical protein
VPGKLKVVFMAINQNHLFEDLNGVKCAIVEKNVARDRVEFLKHILEFNHYTVIVVSSPPPKAAPVAPVKPPPVNSPGSADKEEAIVAASQPEPALPPAPETFTVGVTDVSFNPINAIFGRLLKAPGGHIVTLAYWQQKDREPRDEVPYFNGNG